MTQLDRTECLDHDPTHDTCSGPVEFHPTPPRGTTAWPRCQKHNIERWDRYERSDSIERYAESDVTPDWFDPSIAGERWDDDY